MIILNWLLNVDWTNFKHILILISIFLFFHPIFLLYTSILLIRKIPVIVLGISSWSFLFSIDSLARSLIIGPQEEKREDHQYYRERKNWVIPIAKPSGSPQPWPGVISHWVVSETPIVCECWRVSEGARLKRLKKLRELRVNVDADASEIVHFKFFIILLLNLN
jgi:hypothetical protein